MKKPTTLEESQTDWQRVDALEDKNIDLNDAPEVPTEMFAHFFKSFSDHAKCNLNVSVTGDNEHHKIESVFKAFAKALKMATRRDLNSNVLPTTKGAF